jgi:DNA repair protein RecO (recombination protein O)
MTGFFLSRHVFEPRGLPLPDARASFINAVTNAGVRERALS